MTNDEKWDAYFYPNSDVLINKLGITNKKELQEREAEISFERLVELYDNPIAGNFDVEHWKAIHKYLFGDVYEWAGEYRNINMRKEETYAFIPPEQIDTYLKYELALMNEKIKDVRDKHSLASFLADFYCQLMIIHPFREGNGRSAREFLREFVKEKTVNMPDGPYEINWENFDGKEMEKCAKDHFIFKYPIVNEFNKSLESTKTEEKRK